jgi:hypothetical protein
MAASRGRQSGDLRERAADVSPLPTFTSIVTVPLVLGVQVGFEAPLVVLSWASAE